MKNKKKKWLCGILMRTLHGPTVADEIKKNIVFSQGEVNLGYGRCKCEKQYCAPMRVQPCLRRRIRSVGLLGESEGKRERKSKNKQVK